MQTCPLQICSKDIAYAIILDNKIHRITFSKDLANHIIKIWGKGEVKRIKFRIGRELKEGNKSASGLYGIAKLNGWVLRISLFEKFADFVRDKSRKIVEIWIDKILD